MKQDIKKITVNPEALLRARELYKKNKKLLEEYITNLLDWNSKINLVSRTVSRETVREHVVHSLLATAMGLTSKHISWIDAGTGGGLPGIPLAICEKDSYWYLNDNVKKKMRAVQSIIDSMNLSNTETVAKSISLTNFVKGTGIVSKHAFKIDDILKLLGSKPWKTIIMWKGVEGAELELTSSNKKLNCTLYLFQFGDQEPFYEGKGIVKIER